MFKNHPKGLLAAALANMGERFGFYIMMAILTLFLMSKFGLDEVNAGVIYSVFYALIYILALVGGVLADKTKNYKGTILAGLIMMSVGYLLIAIPTPTPVPAEKRVIFMGLTMLGLLTIAFGNGLFKGNLQAVVGQMYDDPKYSARRDEGFQIFYMFINVGAIFAPLAGMGIRNWWLRSQGFVYNSDLPKLCHDYLSTDIMDTPGAMARFRELASQAWVNTPDMFRYEDFANHYLSAFTTGYHYAFAIAIIAMAISLVVFLANKKRLPNPVKAAENKNAARAAMTPEQIQAEAKDVKQRIYALFAVFAVVIFFWFSFHQNGLTLTYFAKDYTLLKIGQSNISVELFQSINPFFVVFLTPIIVAFFAWLRSKGKEPSTPNKIAIGMGIAACAYLIMTLASMGLPAKSEIAGVGGLPEAERVTPFLLLGTYFVLTVAELFISPLGLSFVSKVAPVKYQGLMQGCWLGATAVGNQLLFIGAIMYKTMPLWMTWGVFVLVCTVSMTVMFCMLRWLNRITAPQKA